MAKHTWKKTRGWHTHSMACWDAEWLEYCRAAEAAGKKTNTWIRDALGGMVRYERVARDDELPAPGGPGPQ